MEAAAFLMEPGRSLQNLVTRERDLKVQYINVAVHPVRSTPRRGLSRPQLQELISGTAEVLELTLAVAGFAEAALDLGIRGSAETLPRFEEVRGLARTMIGFDPVETVAKWAAENSVLTAADRGDPPAFDWESTRSTMLANARSLVTGIPIDVVVAMGSVIDRPEDSHRCRVAFDALRAFLRRTDPSAQAAVKAAGRAYAEGRLALNEVAHLLDLSTTDAVALLEDHGFKRPLSVIALDDEERAVRLAKIREDRLRRGGKPAPTSAFVDRDVAATQRIEQIDARQWLTS